MQGVEEVIIYSVNDGAVMKAWAQDQKIEETFVTFLADPYSELTLSLGMLLDDPGVHDVGLVNRCKRNAILFEDGVAQHVAVAEGDDDPAGDSKPDVTLAEAMLEFLASKKEL